MSDIDAAGYAELLAQAKAQIHAARTRAAHAVDAEQACPNGWSLPGEIDTVDAVEAGIPLRNDGQEQ